MCELISSVFPPVQTDTDKVRMLVHETFLANSFYVKTIACINQRLCSFDGCNFTKVVLRKHDGSLL